MCVPSIALHIWEILVIFFNFLIILTSVGPKGTLINWGNNLSLVERAFVINLVYSYTVLDPIPYNFAIWEFEYPKANIFNTITIARSTSIGSL